MTKRGNVKFRVPIPYTTGACTVGQSAPEWACHARMPPDNFQQINCEPTSYFSPLFLFICSMALSSPVAWAQLFVFFCLAINMVPWITLFFFLLKEATGTSPAFVGVWPSATSGFSLLLPHCADSWKGAQSVAQEEVGPRSTSLCNMRKIFLVVRAIKDAMSCQQW